MTKTPLYQQHLAHNAKMVNFNNWELPINYGSQIKEHIAVRTNAGIFDVSHMTIVDIIGAGGRKFLRKILTNDIDKLPHNGCALYTCMCQEHGGIIDDLIVYQNASDNYRLVLNAATKEADLLWLHKQIEGFAADLQIRNDLAMVAIQGPNAIKLVLDNLSPAQADAVSTLKHFQAVGIEDWFFARTGYTGEDGLEIMLPLDKSQEFWQTMIQAGITPCGLGARDTLRLEAGLLLYGQDMDLTTTPLESGLGWTVAFSPEDRQFIGMGALIAQKQKGIPRKLVGIVLEEEKAIMRHGQEVLIDNTEPGIITSGTFSPTLNRTIALARIPNVACNQGYVVIRGQNISCKFVTPRFVKNGMSIVSDLKI